MRSTYLLFIGLFYFITPIFGQDEPSVFNSTFKSNQKTNSNPGSDSKNALYVNTFMFARGGFTLGYERLLGDLFSAQIGLGFSKYDYYNFYISNGIFEDGPDLSAEVKEVSKKWSECYDLGVNCYPNGEGFANFHFGIQYAFISNSILVKMDDGISGQYYSTSNSSNNNIIYNTLIGFDSQTTAKYESKDWKFMIGNTEEYDSNVYIDWSLGIGLNFFSISSTNVEVKNVTPLSASWGSSSNSNYSKTYEATFSNSKPSTEIRPSFYLNLKVGGLF